MHAALAVEDEFLRQQMQRLAIFRHGDAARLLHCLAHIFAADFARARAQRDAAVAVDAANVRAGNAHHGVLHRRLRDVLGLLHRLLDGVHGLFEIGDHAFAHAARVGNAMPAIAQGVVIHFRHNDAGLGAANVNHRQQVFGLTSHRLRVLLGLCVAGFLCSRSCCAPACAGGLLSVAAVGSGSARFRIRIHDHLMFVAQVHRLQRMELRSPLLHMSDVDLEALQKIAGAEMHQHRALRVRHLAFTSSGSERSMSLRSRE